MSSYTTVNLPRTGGAEPLPVYVDVELPDPDAALDLVAEDTLVEEVSIDGMCGVY